MMFNIHGDVTDGNIDFNPATVGNNTVQAANPVGETFIHDIAFIVDGACVLQIFKGATKVGTLKMAVNQTMSFADIPGMEGEPFFRLNKGDAFIIASDTAIRITGTYKWSLKN